MFTMSKFYGNKVQDASGKIVASPDKKGCQFTLTATTPQDFIDKAVLYLGDERAAELLANGWSDDLYATHGTIAKGEKDNAFGKKAFKELCAKIAMVFGNENINRVFDTVKASADASEAKMVNSPMFKVLLAAAKSKAIELEAIPNDQRIRDLIMKHMNA